MDGDSTCWTVIHGAAGGSRKDRDEFARRYGPVVRDYLAARWRNPGLRAHLDDGVQDVFIECFRTGGVLANADAGRPGGFRAFLYGVVRNVALRFETKQARMAPGEAQDVSFDELPGSEESFSRIFDRAWAKAMVGEAAALQLARAKATGGGAERRSELLRLRFFDGLPIREIARLWDIDPPVVHHEYAKARAEFRKALGDVVAFDHPGTPEEIDARCQELLSLLDRA
jgi:RNA polymerase sigma factor (sigma-70 family)